MLRPFLIVLCAALAVRGSGDAWSEDEVEVEILCDEIICQDYECPYVDECLFGTVPDVCQCCYACAKGPGEQCGGMFDLAGKCAEGFFCRPHPKYSQFPGICTADASNNWILQLKGDSGSEPRS